MVHTKHYCRFIKVLDSSISGQWLRRNISEDDHIKHADNHLQLNLEPGIIGTEHDKQNLGKSSIAVDSDEEGTEFASVA